MKIMANDNISIREDEIIHIFFEGKKDIVRIKGDGSMEFIKDTDSEDLKKGVYSLIPGDKV